MGPREYEELVSDICSRLARDKAAGATVYKDRRLVGRSGQEHQVDVVVELEFIGARIVVLVECKWWNQRVGLEEVMVLAGRLDDIGAHKGMIVTKTGFQKGAINLARSKGIALVLCKDVTEDSGPDPFTFASPSYMRMYREKYSYHTIQEDAVTKNAELSLIFSKLVGYKEKFLEL